MEHELQRYFLTRHVDALSSNFGAQLERIKVKEVGSRYCKECDGHGLVMRYVRLCKCCSSGVSFCSLCKGERVVALSLEELHVLGIEGHVEVNPKTAKQAPARTALWCGICRGSGVVHSGRPFTRESTVNPTIAPSHTQPAFDAHSRLLAAEQAVGRRRTERALALVPIGHAETLASYYSTSAYWVASGLPASWEVMAKAPEVVRYLKTCKTPELPAPGEWLGAEEKEEGGDNPRAAFVWGSLRPAERLAVLHKTQNSSFREMIDRAKSSAHDSLTEAHSAYRLALRRYTDGD